METRQMNPVGYLIADKLDLSEITEKLAMPVLLRDSFELLLKSPESGYIYVVNYGCVVFLNMPHETHKDYLDKVHPEPENPTLYMHFEDLEIDIDPSASYKVLFNKLVLPVFSDDIARIVMLNIAQSVALFRYANNSEELLKETRLHTSELQSRGRLKLRGRSLMKFIGRTLNLRNSIAENLYIFDAPFSTWEDQELNRLNEDLSRQFDLTKRHRSILENLNIVKENLDLFKDIIHHSQSAVLEWIIIILILIEVVHIFV